MYIGAIRNFTDADFWYLEFCIYVTDCHYIIDLAIWLTMHVLQMILFYCIVMKIWPKLLWLNFWHMIGESVWNIVWLFLQIGNVLNWLFCHFCNITSPVYISETLEDSTTANNASCLSVKWTTYNVQKWIRFLRWLTVSLSLLVLEKLSGNGEQHFLALLTSSQNKLDIPIPVCNFCDI